MRPAPPLDDHTVARFWSHVDKRPNGCWVWTGNGNQKGYGFFRTGSRTDGSRSQHSAHRYSWTLHTGPVPDGMQVLHRCDNPPCVNPAHLWLGTNDHNMADRSAKGRQAKGGQIPRCRLTPAIVREIRRAYAAGEGGYRRLAERHGGLNPSTVRAVVLRLTWKHVT